MTMRRTKTKRKTTKTGRRALMGALLWGLLPAALAWGKKGKDAQALIAGTVFRNNGFSLPGAEIVVKPATQDRKKQEWKGFSDARGEFNVRVPAGPASYTLIVKANGYQPQEKAVTLAGEERVEFSFLMEPK